MAGKFMSFFRYPGGKSKLRDKIADVLATQADHNGLQYREPFFGGGSIGLKLLEANSDITSIWINDKDIGIACLWTSVIRYIEDFKARVNDFTPSVDAFHAFKEDLLAIKAMPVDRDKIVDIGFKKLAIHQISYSGLGTKSGGPLGGVDQVSIYKVNCRWSPKYICQKASLLHARFGDIAVHDEACTNLDFSELITSESRESLIYLDPPYYVKGNDLYQHGFTVEDHHRLARLLKNTNHAWVLSYDDCPEVRALYGSWAILNDPFNVKYSITATKKADTGHRASTLKPELLICPNKKADKYVAERVVGIFKSEIA